MAEKKIKTEAVKENSKANNTEKKEIFVKKIVETFKDLKSKSLTELLEIRQGLIVLIDFYDNFAKANTGNYDYNAKDLYDESRKLSEKYNKGLAYVLTVIENKVNEIVFDDEKTMV